MIHQQTLLPSQKKKQNHFLSPNMNLQWNLSNPTQEGSWEMCGTTGCRNTLVLFKLIDILWNHKFLSENSGVGLHTVYCLNELCLPHSGGNILFFVMSIRHKSLYMQLLHFKRESLTTLHTWLLITEWRSTNYTSFLKGVIAL